MRWGLSGGFRILRVSSLDLRDHYEFREKITRKE